MELFNYTNYELPEYIEGDRIFNTYLESDNRLNCTMIYIDMNNKIIYDKIYFRLSKLAEEFNMLVYESDILICQKLSKVIDAIKADKLLAQYKVSIEHLLNDIHADVMKLDELVYKESLVLDDLTFPLKHIFS